MTQEAPGQVGAASTTTGWADTARRLRSGKRDGEVYEQETSGGTPSRGAPARTWRMWAGMQCVDPSLGEVTDSEVDGGRVGAEATVKDCGVAVARAAGEKLDTQAVNRLMVNVGTVVGSPRCRPTRLATARHAVC